MSGQSGHPSLVPVSHWVSYKKKFLFNLTISKNIIMLVNKSITYPCTVGTVDSTYHIYICVEQNISYIYNKEYISFYT